MKMAKTESTIRSTSFGISPLVLLQCGKQTLNILDQGFQVSPRGMTFKTDSYFEAFTSLSIRLQLPPTLTQRSGSTIRCEGAVVECRGDHKRKIYYVTVAFLNLTEADQKHLTLADRVLAAGIQRVIPQAGASSHP